MRRRLLYLIVAALAFVSCEKPQDFSRYISFYAEDGSTTRAMLTDSSLHIAGNRLRIYDVLTGFSGDVSWMDAGNPFYINDTLVYAGNPVWNYGSGRIYPWTSDGTHKFFSWLRYDQGVDKTEVEFCNAAFDSDSLILKIPQKEMNTATTQFDFMYSDIVTMPAASHTANTPINLQLHHLFSALNLSLLNNSGNTVYLKKVTLRGMRNIRSARIDFSSPTVDVTTASLDSTDVVLYTSADPDGEVFADSDNTLNLTDFILMWPQTFVEMNGARLFVEYQIEDQQGNLSNDLTANIFLDRQNVFKDDYAGMVAGTKYSLTLSFQQSTIVLGVTVRPWEYEAYDWDYSDHSIAARSGMFKDGVLAFYRDSAATGTYLIEPTTAEWSAKTMVFQTNDEILMGRFYIEAPTSGRWQITTYPLSAAQYFTVEPTSGEIDAYTDNGKVEFTVKANRDLSPSSNQTLFFNVAIYFNGEWHDANSEFNRKNIKLVLNAN